MAMSARSAWIVCGFCTILGAVACGSGPPSALEPRVLGDGEHRILSAPGFGAAVPKVLVVEVADFDCGYCARATSVVSRLALDYPTEVRFEMWPFPLGNRERGRELAALALAAHEQGKFWAVHDAIYFGGGRVDRDALLARAEALGLDAAAWAEGAKSGVVQATIDHGMQTFEALGVEGTPTFFVNGVPLQGALPYWVFKRVIDDQIRRFDALVSQGSSPEAALEALVRDLAPDPALFWEHVYRGLPVPAGGRG